MPPDARHPAFPSTRWSRILAPNGGRDLDGLARAYERPIRAWLAARLRCRLDDANDATQEAFAWLLGNGLFDKADPARGRFRGFLKRALANFATEQWRRQHAQKRGGCVELTTFDATGEPIDASARTPDEVLDEAWRRELLVAAQAQLQRELEAAGHAVRWALFRDYFLADGDAPDHAMLATRHGITRTDVSNWLDHAKRRYRTILRDRVADTVRDADELDAELRWLFGPTTARGGAA
jgi:hypothetical protein